MTRNKHLSILFSKHLQKELLNISCKGTKRELVLQELFDKCKATIGQEKGKAN